jgi:hypothetical protein
VFASETPTIGIGIHPGTILFRRDEMKIQVNSDKTIAVDTTLMRLVEAEVSRILGRFAIRLTRVEIHLSDIGDRKTGHAANRCLIEVRPAGARPLSTMAKSTKIESSVSQALGKMQRSLATFFGRTGRPVAVLSTAPLMTKKKTERCVTSGREKIIATEKVAVLKPAKLNARGPKKKGIYQARRKSWPSS